MKMRDVRIGQRFRKLDRLRSVWEVVAINHTRDPIPHARLVRQDDPLEVKVVSLITLVDPNFYRRESDL